MVLNTTGADRLTLARWVGASIAMAPQLEGLVTVDEIAREAADRALAQLFVRLLTEDCFEEARPVLQSSNQQSVRMAFGILGEVAMGELMRDPRAMAALTNYVQYIPADALDKFTTE